MPSSPYTIFCRKYASFAFYYVESYSPTEFRKVYSNKKTETLVTTFKDI